MAQIKNTFKSKGELDVNRLSIFEVKNKGKDDEYLEEVNLLDFLKQFHGKEVNFTITEDREVYRVEKLPEEDEETGE